MISKLQYITQGNSPAEHLLALEAACEAGCDWVQLRIKDCSHEAYKEAAKEAKTICTRFGTKLIINDKVDIALAIQSDGVHLGKLDMPVEKARTILGDRFIIGATANTFEDVQQLSQTSANYIGLGPFRFTSTKKNLSPILGITGYQQLITQCQDCGIRLPIVAIGGIMAEDVPELIVAGLHGIAISGAITHASDKKAMVQDLLTKLNTQNTLI